MRKLTLLIVVYLSMFNCMATVDKPLIGECDMSMYVELRTRLQLGDRYIVPNLLEMEGSCGFMDQHTYELIKILAEQSDLASQTSMGGGSESWNKTDKLDNKNKDDIYLRWLELAAHRGAIDAQYQLGLNYLDYSEIEEISYPVCWLSSALIQGHYNSIGRLKKLGISNKLSDLVELLDILKLELALDLNLVTGILTSIRTIEEIRKNRDEAALEKILWEARMKREGRSDLIFAARDLIEKMKSVKKNPKLKMDYIGKCELDSRFPDFFLDLLKKIETR